MKCTIKQREHYDRIIAKTAETLAEALARMTTGRTKNLPPGYKWTKSTWAKEAGIDINTLVSKTPDGAFVFEELNARFAKGRPRRVSRLRALQLQVSELRDENCRLKLLLQK
jgi:hypothetical protein